MDGFHVPTPQSATSMPTVMIPYRQSVPKVYEVLMTPPVSPGHSEDGTGASPNDVMMLRQAPSPYPDKSSTQQSQPQLHQAPMLQANYPHWQHRDIQLALTPPPKPARSLENEEVHVEKSGVLKLTDFEVRGTLGKLRRGFSVYLKLCSLFSSRHWNFWSRSPSPSQVSDSRISKHFCHEGSSES